jgi:hypothetical protein
MVQKGIGFSDHKIDLKSHITCKKLGDCFVRAYKYEGFKQDFMLEQQFNFEYQILHKAQDEKCKHIVPMVTVKFSHEAAFFVLKRYEMDLRVYL